MKKKSNTVYKGDEVAYLRNMNTLCEELQKSKPKTAMIEGGTVLRREKINKSVSKTTEILNEFPFFKTKLWVGNLKYIRIFKPFYLHAGVIRTGVKGLLAK